MALATLDQLKSQLNFKSSDTQYDIKLTLFLEAGSKWVENYCQRIFSQATYTEVLHGNGSNLITPRQWPITSVTEVRISENQDWADSSNLIAASDFGTDSDQTGIWLYSQYLPTAFNSVRVIYVAGYATIPYDLQLANILVSEWIYKVQNRGDSGRTSVGKQGESASVLVDIPPIVKTVLQPYKRYELPTNGPGAMHL
jgi:hypothetical protein